MTTTTVELDHRDLDNILDALHAWATDESTFTKLDQAARELKPELDDERFHALRYQPQPTDDTPAGSVVWAIHQNHGQPGPVAAGECVGWIVRDSHRSWAWQTNLAGHGRRHEWELSARHALRALLAEFVEGPT